jgi:5'-nucleotidase
MQRSQDSSGPSGARPDRFTFVGYGRLGSNTNMGDDMSTPRPTLLLDMDGPLANFDSAFWELCHGHGWEMDIDGPAAPGVARFMSDNVVRPADRKASRRSVAQSGWFRSLPVVDGAIDGVEDLNSHFDIWVCTKPLEANPTCRDEKAAWLAEHIPWLEKRLIICPQKSLCTGAILLDDAPSLRCMAVADWSPVIFPAPYNGATSKWGHLPRWEWGDDASRLLELGNRKATG